MLDKAVSMLREVLPAFEPTIVEGQAGTWFYLPLPPGAEYRFQIWAYEDGEPQICARLEDARDQDDYFWCRSYERPDFSSGEDRSVAFLDDLRRLATVPSRIEERQSFIWRSYECFVEGETARSLGTNSRLAPSFRRHHQVYRSAAPLESVHGYL